MCSDEGLAPLWPTQPSAHRRDHRRLEVCSMRFIPFVPIRSFSPAALVPLALLLLMCGCGSQSPTPPATRTQPETDLAQIQAAASKPAAEGAMCGGYPAVQCEAGSYCAIEKGQCRVIADITGSCRKKPEICTLDYTPVCGCDNKTYANACRAAAAGVSVASEGECK
jgi:hypothetical protein